MLKKYPKVAISADALPDIHTTDLLKSRQHSISNCPYAKFSYLEIIDNSNDWRGWGWYHASPELEQPLLNILIDCNYDFSAVLHNSTT